MLYPGSTSKILFHYQPWFGSSEHIDVGYNENETAVIVNQIAKMIAMGGYGLIVDWYGSTNPARRFHLNTTEVIARYLGSCFSASCPFHMAIMEDKGAFSSHCPKGKKDQTSCIVKNLNRDMDYINSHYAKQPWYLTDRDNPIVLFFLHEPEWSGTDWGRVWSEVKSHTNSFPRPFKFVFEEEDVNCWRHILGDGCYVWMNPAKWSPQAQFNWGASSNPKPVYYQDFYKNAVANPDKIAIGAIKKGFDDNNASWGTNRVTAQQCGQTLLNTMDLISNYYNSRHQRSGEHTSELQSHSDLVCRLLLEKKKKQIKQQRRQSTGREERVGGEACGGQKRRKEQKHRRAGPSRHGQARASSSAPGRGEERGQ